MGRNTADFRFGMLGSQGNDPRYAGPAALNTPNTEDQWAAHDHMRLADNGNS
jgi:hypothetical protein